MIILLREPRQIRLKPQEPYSKGVAQHERSSPAAGLQGGRQPAPAHRCEIDPLPGGFRRAFGLSRCACVFLHNKLSVQRIATQIETHRPNCIDLYTLFAIAHSPRNGLTAYFAISPVIGLCCHRHPSDKAGPRPVGPTSPPQDLTPASSRQDHTTSPSAPASFVLRACARSRVGPRPAITIARRHRRGHRIPPRARDDRETPLCRDGTAET